MRRSFSVWMIDELFMRHEVCLQQSFVEGILVQVSKHDRFGS